MSDEPVPQVKAGPLAACWQAGKLMSAWAAQPPGTTPGAANGR
jgi:hypothetical protein